MTYHRLVVCEPQCQGFEHVPVNAGFLQAVCSEWSGARVHWVAEESHTAQVALYIGPMDLEVHTTPGATGPFVRKRRELGRIWKALHLGSAQRAPVVLLSLSGTALLFVKVVTRLWFRRTPVLGVLHGRLSALVRMTEESEWSVRSVFAKIVLRTKGTRHFRLLVLSPAILQQLNRHSVDLGAPVSAVHHPLALPPGATVKTETPKTDFTFLGTTNPRKGFETFMQVARAVRRTVPSAPFSLAGFVSTPHAEDDLAEWLKGYSTSPVAHGDFESRLSTTRYVVWTGMDEHYALAASGTFVEAMRRGIPIIALRNDFMQYYAVQFGPIGYLVDGPGEMAALIEHLLHDEVDEEYERMRENALKCGRVFAAESSTGTLRDLLSGLTR